MTPTRLPSRPPPDFPRGPQQPERNRFVSLNVHTSWCRFCNKNPTAAVRTTYYLETKKGKRDEPLILWTKSPTEKGIRFTAVNNAEITTMAKTLKFCIDPVYAQQHGSIP